MRGTYNKNWLKCKAFFTKKFVMLIFSYIIYILERFHQ